MDLQLKAVIFDFDGLLIDSQRLWDQVDLEIFAERGFKPTKQLFARVLGTGSRRTLEIYKEEVNFRESVDELIKEREKRFFKLLDRKIIPMVGAVELVELLIKRGIKLAIATSGPHKSRMRKILREIGIFKYISVIVTGEEIKRLKPAPDIFLIAAKRLNIDPRNCLVFEDAPSGIMAAKKARMIAYGVNRDEKTRKELKKAGADRVFRSLKEIDLETFIL